VDRLWVDFEADMRGFYLEEDERLLFSEEYEEGYLFGTGRLSGFQFSPWLEQESVERLFSSLVIRE
jgi:hypothetical protein